MMWCGLGTKNAGLPGFPPTLHGPSWKSRRSSRGSRRCLGTENPLSRDVCVVTERMECEATMNDRPTARDFSTHGKSTGTMSCRAALTSFPEKEVCKSRVGTAVSILYCSCYAGANLTVRGRRRLHSASARIDDWVKVLCGLQEPGADPTMASGSCCTAPHKVATYNGGEVLRELLLMHLGC